MHIKYLSIDWGASRIGLATGDSENKIAIPFKVARDIKEVLAVIKEEEIDEIIIGQPIKMSGEKNNLTAGFNLFLESLKKKTALPIILVDERLSSKGADALFGTKKTKAKQDAVAAMIILQSYFDNLSV
ncbi:MAG: hypothetical protein US83_C0008G0060 [Candidatus Falkowbacteria bacterium GW2011_GWC2_38_22]|uniref:Putative pre-16S rRNA nuclease n=1 Tax=Candidatus Falkowbacteria bacterium GW2011_GWE1_38_31 TaxID=1618638 RepID=A0A0G0JQZ6_9BACT|nr:MAG: hypothetical protein US73_C0006G0056 [Candidatus Falkowbacteria bacterium GW2011_GWF2_38_1205]KKQ61219.1 MAG: hypothetical protein US83_C0008G0060 [Candidatus Falkowbacteria bacterium GW2011_GWC2_38_22]KKQ63276.1 MAG: hypothetical protein US84_C0007G0018 [Candidatus Falkowbacteria bacterium GW2011_GWF1_38_22]KKQ65606.1 MAG: hypothetical protein US87_C0006G0056 [Candidatus Falkowbacteria bacterium GW2011_GWE2_38_254]KKQ70008.1 MAG: hypothetical protein US91_C0007G0018 [Candidatus Falkowb